MTTEQLSVPFPQGRIHYVVEHCGLRYREPAPAGSTRLHDRLLYFGDDAAGAPLEVVAVEVGSGDLLVIHAMPLRRKYRQKHKEAKKWRS